MKIEFTWDSEKDGRNRVSHGVSFETAREVFFDPNVLIVEDCEVDGEIRYHALGFTGSRDLLLIVVFVDCSTEEEEILRIVSARKGDKYEERTYARQFEEGN